MAPQYFRPRVRRTPHTHSRTVARTSIGYGRSACWYRAMPATQSTATSNGRPREPKQALPSRQPAEPAVHTYGVSVASLLSTQNAPCASTVRPKARRSHRTPCPGPGATGGEGHRLPGPLTRTGAAEKVGPGIPERSIQACVLRLLTSCSYGPAAIARPAVGAGGEHRVRAGYERDRLPRQGAGSSCP